MRAAEVGRLMLGELNRPMEWISSEQFIDKTRHEIKVKRGVLRKSLRQELRKFCRNNFEGIDPKDLGRFYEPLYAQNSIWRMPLTEFVKQLNRPKERVLTGVPLHSTIVLSPWGLKIEFPELHLVKDLATAFNYLLEIEDKLDKYKHVSWHTVKKEEVTSTVAELQRQAAFLRRMAVLSCFNLAEAYINGIAWGFVQTHDISHLTKNDQKILEEGKESILKKLAKVPQIVTSPRFKLAEHYCNELRSKNIPDDVLKLLAGYKDKIFSDKDEILKIVEKEIKKQLTDKQKELIQKHVTEIKLFKEDREPLKIFKETIKPFRDSIVHASPFSAPEQFGGYEKLSKIYELDYDTVRQTIEITLEIIGLIHRFIGGQTQSPQWIPERSKKGKFIISEKKNNH